MLLRTRFTVSMVLAWGTLAWADPTCRYTAADFDGDHKSDFVLFRPQTAVWSYRLSTGPDRENTLGETDLKQIPLMGDFDGDGKSEAIFFNPTQARWKGTLSSGRSLDRFFGDRDLRDLPVTADFDGDCVTDLAVFRSATGEWLLRLASGKIRIEKFGEKSLTEIPVPADYDGDGKAELAVFRPSTGEWRIRRADGSVLTKTFGGSNLSEIPVPADYDGDGKVDLALFRTESAEWTIDQTKGFLRRISFGETSWSDYPVAAPIAAIYRLRKGDIPTPTPPKPPEDNDPPAPTPPDEGGYDWQKSVKFTEIPVVSRVPGDAAGSKTLEDVWVHSRRQERPSASAPPTNWGHETTHYLHNEQSQGDQDFIYFENGKGIQFARAKTPNDLSRYLPAGAKRIAAHRLNLYFSQCAGRRSNALGCYLDEYGAYVVTARIGTESVQAGKFRGSNQDAVDGAMDFLYFVSAMMLATDKYDAQELQNNPQLKATFAMLAEQTQKLVSLGLTMSQFNGFHARELQQHFISSPENSAIRRFLVEEYGSAWTKRVFGF